MTRILLVLVVALLARSASLQAEEREYVTRGEVLSVSVEDRTLTMVPRPFTITADTDVMTDRGQSIELGQILPGAQVTIHFVLDSGKN
jgi:hypothetical protein